MTERQIEELGWKHVKQYTHDEFLTNRYRNVTKDGLLGPLTIEFTYEGEELVTCDLTIDEVASIDVTFEQVQILTNLFGK